jgi:hypothetical protein
MNRAAETPTSNDELLTAPEIAAIHRMSQQTIRAGTLPAIKIGRSARIRCAGFNALVGAHPTDPGSCHHCGRIHGAALLARCRAPRQATPMRNRAALRSQAPPRRCWPERPVPRTGSAGSGRSNARAAIW